MLTELYSTLAAILIHELGHLIALILTDIRPSGGRLGIWGIRINVNSSKISYPKQIFISLAGSLANILTSLFAAESLKAASLAYGFFNLLPISALDGGEILSSVMCLCGMTPSACQSIRRKIDRCFILVLWICAVYCALKFGTAGLLLSTVYLIASGFMARGVD